MCGGLDLLDFFRGRYSWRKLRVILERLPVASAYRQAVLEDPEMVAEFASLDDEATGPPPGPPLSEWTQEVSLLANISDQLQALRIAVIASNEGGKPPEFVPETRPITAFERARNMRDLQSHYDLVAEVRAAQERWVNDNLESGVAGDA